MEATTIVATPRVASGSGVARRLRATGQIPAIAYGKTLEPLTLALSPKALLEAFEGPKGRNVILKLEVEGGPSVHAILVDSQRHPVTRELLHVDLLRVTEEQPIEVKVPLVLSGKSEGVVAGGELRQVMRKVPVRAVPAAIPEKIEADISGLGIDDMLHAEALPLPEGVELCLGPKRTVALVMGGRREMTEEPEAESKAADGAASDTEKAEAAEGGDAKA